MTNYKFSLLGLFLLTIVSCSKCDDCTVNPDLISDLAAPSTDIIVGEPVDWDYVVESVEDNSEDCDILKTIASIGNIIIDYFTDENDSQSDMVLNIDNNVNGLSAGEMQTITTAVDVFNNEGIYLLGVTADFTDVIEERNEDNNTDNAEVNARPTVQSDLFQNASEEFMEKLAKASAIIIIKRGLNSENSINSYQGKPIYYAKY